MTTLFMHHYYVPTKAQGHVCKTDAHLQFDNADHIGREAVLETYDRLFNLWKTDSSMIVELKLVLNHRIVFWDEMHRNDPDNPKYLEFTLLYLDLYDKTYNYIESRDYKNIRKKWEVLE